MSSDESSSSDDNRGQMGPFEIGQIKAHMEHGLGASEIARRVKKQDLKSVWTDNAVEAKMKKLKKYKFWRGARKLVSGTKRKTTKAFDKQLARTIVKNGAKSKQLSLT